METPPADPTARLDPILKRFPTYKKEITASFSADPEFAEICEDYLEVRQLVGSWEKQDELTRQIKLEYQELLEELKVEIEELLLHQRPKY